MSETLENQGGVSVEVATEDDVKRTLRELQGRNAELEREVNAERARRQSLETNLDGERVARTTAELQRDEHASRVVSEAEGRWNAEKNATEAAIAARLQAVQAAQDDFATHSEMGEWNKAAEAQAAIAEATAELYNERQKLKYLETNKDRIVPQAPRRTETPARVEQPTTTHRYARFINGPLVGGEEAFLDARPRFQTDETYRKHLFAASEMANTKFARGSEPYLREIERILGEELTDAGDGGQQRDTPPPRQQTRTQSADLPASRRSEPGRAPAGSQVEIRLTPEQVEMADGMYGNPNDPNWYIADPKERYTRYAANMKKVADRL